MIHHGHRCDVCDEPVRDGAALDDFPLCRKCKRRIDRMLRRQRRRLRQRIRRWRAGEWLRLVGPGVKPFVEVN